MSNRRAGTAGPRSVLLALGGDPREEPLLAAMERAPGRVRVARRCLDLADLLTAAEAGLAGAAGAVVVSASLARLDGVAVARLSGVGLEVLALVERSDDASALRLRALGVHQVLRVEDWSGGRLSVATGAGLLDELAAALAGGALPGAGGPTPAPRAAQGSVLGPASDADPGPACTGRLVAVWGPTGAPGRTTIAVTLADELARLHVETLLADADTYGPSLGQTLAVLDEASGLAAAARDANAGVLDVEALARCARLLRPGLRLLTGVTRADRWPELPASALAKVWAIARSLALWTVVDCGFCLEQDEEIAYDTYTPHRNAATLVTLRAADLVVAVGGADPVGLQRLIRLLPDLKAAAPQAAVRVVVNQVRRGPVGHNYERRLLESLDRYAGVGSAILVPADRDAVDACLACGRTLAEVAPSSAARAAVLELAVALVS